MAALLTRRSWTRQPPGWAAPAKSAGLIHVWKGGDYANVMDGAGGTPSSGVSRLDSIYGQIARFNADTDSIGFSSAYGTPDYISTGDCSVLFVGLPAVNAAVHPAGGAGGAGDFLTWGLFSSNAWFFGLRTIVNIISTLTAVSGHTYAVLMAYRRAVQVTFHVYDITIDSYVSQVVTDATTPTTSSIAAFRVGARDSGSTTADIGWDSDLYLHAFWTRELALEEARELVFNPYQIFKRTARFYFPTTGVVPQIAVPISDAATGGWLASSP